MWYYTLNNQQVGPVDENEIRKLVASGVITSATMLWTNGMPGWAPIGQTALASLLPVAAAGGPPPMVAPAYMAPVIPDEPEVALMKKLFMWFWISLIGILLFGIGIIPAAVLFFIIIYKAWGIVQREGVRGVPDKMVAFGFIPGWNFYWAFPEFRGLAKELNDAMDKANVTADRINLDFVTWMLICLFASSITFGVSAIAFIVMWIMYTNKVKNAYNALFVANKK
jgi:hypothetical protein